MKKTIKTALLLILGVLVLGGGCTAFLFWGVPNLNYGFARSLSQEEAELRMQLVTSAEKWLGANEADGTHRPIIDLYNTQSSLPLGYSVTYEDSWCAAFGTVAAMDAGLTDIIPPECGCQRQIALFMELGHWEEDDNYLPLPGDYIFYAWEDTFFGDCTGWADHVGIVAGTWGPFIKVIEGNKEDAVDHRFILRNDPSIRGFGLPDYTSKCP